MKTRRRMLVGAGLACAAIPRLVMARAGTDNYRIGFLASIDRDTYRRSIEALEQAMRDHGYVEGKNLLWERRFAEGRYERLPFLATEIAKSGVGMIIAAGSPATRAAQEATSRIPIISLGSANPVAAGFVKNLARPEGNITGFYGHGADVLKKIEILRTLVPGLRRIGLFFNPRGVFDSVSASGLEKISRIGLEGVPLPAGTAEDIERAFGVARSKRVDCINVPWEGLFLQHGKLVAHLALSNRLPSVSPNREFVDSGGLASYGHDVAVNYRRAAEYVDRLSNGAMVSELPFQRDDRLELCLNRKTAKALGISIPQEMLLRTDLVVE